MSLRICLFTLVILWGIAATSGCSGLNDEETGRDAGSDTNDMDQDAEMDANGNGHDAEIDADEMEEDGGTDADIDAETDTGDVGLATLSLSKIVVGTFPDGSESLQVNTQDEEGETDTYGAVSLDESIASVSAAGSQLTVTGVNIGDTSIVITSGTGLERELEVKVYDPYVFETDDLFIRYVDEFTWRWNDSGSGGADDGGFWHPVAPAGYHALGSLGIQGYGDPNQKYWMIVVKEKEGAEALLPPVSYQMEYDDSGSGATNDGSFWTPICPDGFVALGAVAQSGWSAPSLDDATCVRNDLTVEGQAGGYIWNDRETGANDWVGIWRIDIKQREDLSDTRLYLDTGTFVAWGNSGGNCSASACWTAPTSYPHMHVLSVKAPMLFDTGNSWTPRLNSYDEPPSSTEPFDSRAILVPFSAGLSGSQIQGNVHSYVTSPLLRFEKTVQFHRLGWISCGGSTTCDLQYEVNKGIEETKSETFSHSVGISVTAEAGISFMGAGGSVSVTVNYEFGYESTESRAVFSSESWSATVPCPPGYACAIWTDNTTFQVKKHLPTGGFAVLDGGRLDFNGGISLWTDDYSENEQ